MASIPQWTSYENKLFELVQALFPEGSPSGLETSAQLLEKPLEEVKNYYEALVHDSKTNLPEYPEDDYVSGPGRWSTEEHKLFLDGLNKYGKGEWKSISKVVGTRNSTQVKSHAQSYFLKQNSDKKKLIHWSPEEHRLFLDGLKKYGKGDWKNISKVVGTRNSTQVASHARHYFMWQNSKRNNSRSIHDKTLEDAENVAVSESTLESIEQHPHSGDQIPPDNQNRSNTYEHDSKTE